ncbi:MAG: hypothetical protein J0M04_03200 [Verrucomicrobia bacterium]|nr:hypothetical protein [Verrucomicrobiota bacterium]
MDHPISREHALLRRSFLKLAGSGAVAAFCGRFTAFAGPFEGADFVNLIPSDKKLRPEWIKSLFERGTPTEYTGAELDKIGMPIGGIGTGQLYLGGDGRLWHWDIFNLRQPPHFTSSSGDNYAKPPEPHFPIEQSFSIRIGEETRFLDRRGFRDMRFRGQYPMATVDYRAADWPVTVTLEAFTPYCPLNVPDSSLPATVMRFLVRNTGPQAVEVELSGTLENAVCLGGGTAGLWRKTNHISQETGLTLLHCTAEENPRADTGPRRPNIIFEDFENGYGNWNREGEAFGDAPAGGTLSGQQNVSGFLGKGLVNSFLRGDATTGKLISKPFRIERRFIGFLIGGGDFAEQTCVNLIVDRRVARSATGRAREMLEPAAWEVAELEGKPAHIEIIDAATGPWGHINVDQIVFTDEPPAVTGLKSRPDYGSMALSLLGDPTGRTSGDASVPLEEKLVGSLGRVMSIEPGKDAEFVFVITWFFPRPMPDHFRELEGADSLRRSYSNRFDSAAAVARHVAKDFDRLAGQTRLWTRTWYDSTLPYWFLDRTLAPICTLATSTCYHFQNGRFYAFEGVYCCAGTCQHVWNYAQAVGRLFPELERDLRQRTDFGTAWHENGAIDYRGEAARSVAHDGMCGVILRAYREHLTASDGGYLSACWPRIRKSIGFLIAQDGDENGIIEGEQYNTLDASWFGPMAWISSFYIAALRAGEAMAREQNDPDFADRCAKIAARGSELLVSNLFNGEYFIHKPDPKKPDSPNSNDGCHIDQLMGQAWALQVGLPRVTPPRETITALESIWRFNFAPDVGPFRAKSPVKGGRWYAMAGEGGVVMTTFPRGGADLATGKAFGYYLNEVWTGQEHQLAAHMIAEGLIEKGFAVTRALHDRHHAARRNPYNEVECSDHYTRAMSSYGSFLAACGFDYHGPKGHIGFAPRLSPSDFKAAFTAAEGWGSFAIAAGRLEIMLLWGRLKVKTISLATRQAKSVTATVGDNAVPCRHTWLDGRLLVTLESELTLTTGQMLSLSHE